MKVLIACEESQRVCAAFRAKGHEAYSCDILDCSGNHPEWHIQGDVLGIINPIPNGYIWFYTNDGNPHFIKKWDIIIAFPPCTHLATSGTRWFKEKQADGRQGKAIKFFLQLANAKCDKIAIENPVGIMSTKFRKPDQIIHPWQFGDQAEKRTCLWLKGLPLLKPTNEVDRGEFVTFKRRSNGKEFKQPKWYFDALRSPDRAKLRSKTFEGIARAMAEQWG